MLLEQDTPKGLQDIRKELDDTTEKLKDTIDREERERKHADDELKDDIDRIIGQRDVTVPSLVSKINLFHWDNRNPKRENYFEHL